MPCAEFARWLSNETGVSVVIEDTLDRKPVTIEVVEQTVDDTLSAVARRMGVQVTRSGTLYFLGTLRKEDKGILVRRCRRLGQDDLKAAVSTVMSDFGQVASFPDGLMVVGDRVEVLTKIHDLLEQVERAESPVWVVQLYLVDLAETDKHNAGLDVTPTLDISLAFAAGSAASVKPTASLKGGLDSVLKAARTLENSSIVAEPLFVLGDGQEAKIVRGEKVPVPRRTVSNQGTVTTQGYDFIQTGYKTDLKLREVGPQSASLSVVTELSTITRFVETAPVTAIESMETVAVMESGGVYLLGALERSDEALQMAQGLKWGQGKSHEARTLQVWARAYRVAGPATAAGRAASDATRGSGDEQEPLGPVWLPGVEGDPQPSSTLPANS